MVLLLLNNNDIYDSRAFHLERSQASVLQTAIRKRMNWNMTWLDCFYVKVLINVLADDSNFSQIIISTSD